MPSIKLTAVILLLAVAACHSGEPLPPIEGPWTALNPDRWQPTDQELQTIKQLPEK